jgi:hypothetical protein
MKATMILQGRDTKSIHRKKYNHDKRKKAMLLAPNQQDSLGLHYTVLET